MARYKRTNTVIQWKRIKGKFKKVGKIKNKEAGNNPAKVTDEQIIMAEKDPEKRAEMFGKLQSGKTRRSMFRNLTTQGVSIGGQASSSAIATEALKQNIAGGYKQSEKGREDPEDNPDNPDDPNPPAY